MESAVNNFLKRFHKYDNIDDVFTKGCCYWFAQIIFERFYDPDAWDCAVEIMYDEVINHFGCRIYDKVYDITGDVTHKYNWKPWCSLNDDALIERIYRDCINF